MGHLNAVDGILTVLLAALPVKVLDARNRLACVGIGGLIVILSIITGNMQAFTYPQFVEIAWIFPIVAAGVIIFLNGQQSKETTIANQAPTAGVSEPTVPVYAQPFVVPPAGPVLIAEPDPLAGLASDPNTPLETLAELAHHHPELRPAIAANPSTYPDLVAWLEQFDDDAVRAALRGRD